jgi:hypothetical protein
LHYYDFTRRRNPGRWKWLDSQVLVLDMGGKELLRRDLVKEEVLAPIRGLKAGRFTCLRWFLNSLL